MNNDVFINHYEFTNIDDILTEKHGEKFKEYRENFRRANDDLEENDIPMYIVLSVNSYCNLLCSMCSRNYKSFGERKDLPLDVIKKIADECKSLGIPSVLVGATSEALLRKDIKEVINHINEADFMDRFFITNGTMLTEELAELFVDSGYERLFISLDAATPETYKKVRGGNLQLVEKNIERLLQIKKEKGSRLPIVRVSFVKTKENVHEVEQFIDKWKNKVDLIDIQNMVDYSDLNNLKELDEFEQLQFKCPCPFRLLYIDFNGDIYPCSSDYCYHMKIGNIENMSIKEAWNSELMKELRASIKAGRLNKICANCANNVG